MILAKVIAAQSRMRAAKVNLSQKIRDVKKKITCAQFFLKPYSSWENFFNEWMYVWCTYLWFSILDSDTCIYDACIHNARIYYPSLWCMYLWYYDTRTGVLWDWDRKPVKKYMFCMYMILNRAFMAFHKMPAFVKPEFVGIGKERYILHTMQRNWERTKKHCKSAKLPWNIICVQYSKVTVS